MDIKTICYCISFISILITTGCIREGNPYLRVRDGFFEVASKSFAPEQGNGPIITLLGAVHVGEPSYYQQVQSRLDKAALVLYERIGTPEEIAEIKAHCPESYDEEGGHRLRAKLMNLVTQPMHIKDRAHFVHADSSMKEVLDHYNFMLGKPLCERLERRQKDPFNELKVPAEDAVKLRNETALKLIKDMSFDYEFAGGDDRFMTFHRNGYIIKKLEEEIPKYPNDQKEIIIFYGAIHLPDVEKSLKRMGYKLKSTEWLSAFSL
jgi:hypothetical protein